MNENRLPDYLLHMQQAAVDARSFVEGLSKAEFLTDKRTQHAVIMSLVIIGEAVTKVMDRYSAFANIHSEIPWRSMRNMRNRIALGYFDIDLDIVWNTVQVALPDLIAQLPQHSQRCRQRKFLKSASATHIIHGIPRHEQ
jgi:uncharacterized protein with HEPN domain